MHLYIFDSNIGFPKPPTYLCKIDYMIACKYVCNSHFISKRNRVILLFSLVVTLLNNVISTNIRIDYILSYIHIYSFII